MSSGSSNSPYFDRNAQFYLKMFNANTAKVIRLFFWTFGKKKLNAKKLKGKKIKLKLNFQLTQQNLVIQSNSSFTQSNSSLTVVNSSLCNVTQPNLQCPLWEYKERFLPLRQKFSLLRSLVFFSFQGVVGSQYGADGAKGQRDAPQEVSVSGSDTRSGDTLNSDSWGLFSPASFTRRFQELLPMTCCYLLYLERQFSIVFKRRFKLIRFNSIMFKVIFLSWNNFLDCHGMTAHVYEWLKISLECQ